MKQILTPLILACCLLLSTGCETTINDPDKFNKIQLVVENGTAFAVKTYVDSISDIETSEKVRQYFLDVTKFIHEATSTGKVEPQLFRDYVLTEIRDKIPDKFRVPVINALDLSLGAYNTFYAENVRDKIDNSGKAIPIINRIITGIMVGLDPVSGNAIEVNPLEGYTDFKLE